MEACQDSAQVFCTSYFVRLLYERGDLPLNILNKIIIELNYIFKVMAMILWIVPTVCNQSNNEAEKDTTFDTDDEVNPESEPL